MRLPPLMRAFVRSSSLASVDEFMRSGGLLRIDRSRANRGASRETYKSGVGPFESPLKSARYGSFETPERGAKAMIAIQTGKSIETAAAHASPLLFVYQATGSTAIDTVFVPNCGWLA